MDSIDGSTGEETPSKKKVVKKTAKKVIKKPVSKNKITLQKEKKSALPKGYKPKAHETVLDKAANYQIILDSKKKEVDLHFSLTNPVEDRYFAYALTLMDVFRTLEEISEFAPPDVMKDFVTTVKILKGLSESIKHKIEEDAGFKKPLMNDEKKEKIKKMLASVKEKLEAKYPDAKVKIVEGKRSDRDDINQTLRDIIADAEREMNDEIHGKKSSKKKPSKKKIDLEDDGLVPSRYKSRSEDLEL